MLEELILFPGSLDSSNVSCEVSVTTMNGYKPTCKGEVVFFDNFSGTSISNKWSHVVQIANEWVRNYNH